MKRTSILWLALAASLSGCGKEADVAVAPPSSTPAPPSQAAAALAETARQAKDQAVAAATDAAQQLISAAKAKSDDLLAGIGTDIQAKVRELGTSLSTNATVKGYLDSVVQSLSGNKSADALGAYQKLAAAKLTPEQTRLAGDLKNLVGAYIVQDNFATLNGSESDVGQVVKALRAGNLAGVAQPLQRVLSNAQLTAPQKDLLGKIADTYAPGLKGVGTAVGKGLDLIKGQ